MFLGDGEAVSQLTIAGERPGHIEENPAADEVGGHLLDAGYLVTGTGHHIGAAAAVPGQLLVEDVPQPVPLRAGLQRHDHHVVRAAKAVREPLRLVPGVQPGLQHGVQRVGAAAEARLRAIAVELLCQRDGPAAAHQ